MQVNKQVRGFEARNRGTAVCQECGKRTWENRVTSGMCEPCYEVAGLEVSHEDGYHDNAREDDCPLCKEESK